MSNFGMIDFEKLETDIADEILSWKMTDEEMDVYSLEFLDFSENEDQSLEAFNERIQDQDMDGGAQWLEEEEFRTLYNYIRRFNHTYKSIACEMRISLTTYVEEEEEEEVVLTFGEILHNSLRRSDIIMRRNNDYYLLLPDLTEQNKFKVLSRIRGNLQREGLYSSVDMNVDSMIIGPDREYETWFRVAV